MKILMRPIDMIAWFTTEGVPRPIKYRLTEEETYQAVRVDRVIARLEEKWGGNRMLVYRCQSVINGREQVYELKYEMSTCKWFLYKM